LAGVIMLIIFFFTPSALSFPIPHSLPLIP
jgi:hypothetical protein